MNKTVIIVLVVIIGLLSGTGFLVYKVLTKPVINNQETEEVVEEELPVISESIKVTASKSKTAANTVVLEAAGMEGKYSWVEYELTYDSEGLIKGVNSGSKPIDVSGKPKFEREVYLGTCSRNVCKPDVGVDKVSVSLKFTDSAGKRSQYSGEFAI